MKVVKIHGKRFLVKRVVESQEEPVGTHGLLWIHIDPISRVKLYFLWKCGHWINVGIPRDVCCDCSCEVNSDEENE